MSDTDTLGPEGPRPLRRLKVVWQARFGRPGALGLLALALAGGLISTAAPLLQARADSLDAELRRAREQIDRRAARAAQRPPARAEDRLPSFDQRTADLALLVGLAAEAGVDLPRADYRLEAATPNRPGPLQWHLQLPVTGGYAQLRRFVGLALNRLPHASLDTLQIERADTLQAELETTLELNLHYRDAPGTASRGPAP